MTPETEALLQQCRAALLRQNDENLAALLKQWFELMIGDESLDEDLDDLCLWLNYSVCSWGSPTTYATYTSWWEVEGYLAPEAGEFLCFDRASLRQRLRDLPIQNFGIVIELAYQALVALAEHLAEPGPPTGQTLLRELVNWLAIVRPEAKEAAHAQLKQRYREVETREQQQRREQESVELAKRRGYLLVYPSTTNWIKDTFRHWCKVDGHPCIYVEMQERQLARLNVTTRTLMAQDADIPTPELRASLTRQVEPFLTRAKSKRYQARVEWASQRQVTLENILAGDAQLLAEKLVALWSEFLAEKRLVNAPKAAPLSKAETACAPGIECLHTQEADVAPLLPLSPVALSEELISLLTRDHLRAFLSLVKLPAGSKESKATLVQRVMEKLKVDSTARAQFFEVFVHELAVPPWELETLLACSSPERKRWVEEGKLPILDYCNFKRGTYPVFDRRIVLGISRGELEEWRLADQARTHERKKAGARQAATSRKAKR